MKRVLLILALSVFGSPVVADHNGPGKMWNRHFVPYFDLYLTKELGPPHKRQKINVDSFGSKAIEEIGNIKKEDFDRFFKFKFNLATIIRKRMKSSIHASRRNQGECLGASILIPCCTVCLCQKQL